MMQVSQQRCRGFTLVELLVALTIVGLISGLLSNSLGFSLGTADRIEGRLQQAESLHQAKRAFRRQVQIATPLVVTSDSAESHIAFAANARELHFVAPLPGLDSGGLLHRISMNIDGESGRLVMSYEPFLPDKRDDSADSAATVLIEGFSSASFDYRDTLGPGRTEWQSEWRDPSRLPDIVRLSIEFEAEGDAAPVEFIVAIKATLPNRQGEI